MPSLIYTQQKSKLSKKQRAAREALLEEQRAIRRSLQAEARQAPLTTQPSGYRRETPHYPSLNSDGGVATKAPTKVYTGTSMIGIGQMAKSNAVPIFKREDAEDIARMRR